MKLWAHQLGVRSLWFRIYGWGIAIWDSSMRPDRFSIRMKHQRVLKIRTWRIEWLGRAHWWQLTKEE